MVETRAPDTEQISQRVVVSNASKKEKWLFLKDALWGGGVPHRSWLGGRGGQGALVAGEGAGA